MSLYPKSCHIIIVGFFFGSRAKKSIGMMTQYYKMAESRDTANYGSLSDHSEGSHRSHSGYNTDGHELTLLN